MVKIRSIFQRSKRPLVIVLKTLLVGVLLGFLIWVGYAYDWTGFGSYSSPTGEFQRSKTLWDWMNLLIVPVVLAIGAILFSQAERRVERDIEADRLRESTLQTYLDQVAELVLEKKLHEVEQYSEVHVIARARTLATLQRLDETRKGILIQFLFESDLIMKDKPVVVLSGADLRGVNLSGASHFGFPGDIQVDVVRAVNLSSTNLSNTNLSEADLFSINLSDANLKGVIMFKTNVKSANLIGANMSNVIIAKANLEKAKLKNANLTGALMMDVNMRGADLTGANFSGASLANVDLTNAVVSKEQLMQAKMLKNVTLEGGKVGK